MDIKEDTEGNKYGATVLGASLIYQIALGVPTMMDKALAGIVTIFLILNIIAIFKK
jgi:hypothetical protein